MRTRILLALGLTCLAVAAAGAWALRRLDTPEARRGLVARAGAALGTAVRVEEVEIGLVAGVRLRGVAVANPAPFEGDLVRAESVSLRHRLLPLLLGRVVVDRLELRRPVLSLLADSRGVFNYERLGGRAGSPGAATGALPLRVVLSHFGIEDGTLQASDATGARLLRIERLALAASVEAGPEGLHGGVRLRGALAAGGIAGSLRAQARLARAAGPRATPTGAGRADVDDCRVERSALFSLLATALRLPELQRPDLDECRVEFRLGGGRVAMPLVSLKGRPAQVTGAGSVGLASGALDFDLTLALQSDLVARLPAKELRAAFRDRGDGYAVVSFELRGSAARPQSDLAGRLAKAGAAEAAKDKLGGLLDRVF